MEAGMPVDAIDAARVERAGAALEAVHLVALFQEKFGQVGSVLAGDAGDECDFAQVVRCSRENCKIWMDNKLTDPITIFRIWNQVHGPRTLPPLRPPPTALGDSAVPAPAWAIPVVTRRPRSFRPKGRAIPSSVPRREGSWQIWIPGSNFPARRARGTGRGSVRAHNRDDFLLLAEDYRVHQRYHAGIIIAVRRTPYELASRLRLLMNDVTADDMR